MMMKNKKEWEEKSKADPDDGKADPDDDKVSQYAAIGLGVAGAALVAWGVSSLFSGEKTISGEKTSKMMKAPGRPGVYISRDDFVSDTAAYFRNLRNDRP